MIALVQQNNKANTKFYLSLHCNSDESYLYVNKTEICKFKANDNINWYNFCLESESKGFTNDEQSEFSLNDTAYDFLVEHSLIKKEGTHNIRQYSMVKNKIKFVWVYLKNIYRIINLHSYYL